jgi:hypothetical protein
MGQADRSQLQSNTFRLHHPGFIIDIWLLLRHVCLRTYAFEILGLGFQDRVAVSHCYGHSLFHCGVGCNLEGCQYGILSYEKKEDCSFDFVCQNQ